MNKDLKELFDALSGDIQKTYEGGVTMEEAEKLAGKFLGAQMIIIDALRTADLDSRMRKAGFKAIAASVYMESGRAAEKRPTEAALSAMVDSNKLVIDTRQQLDAAEVDRDTLKNYLDVFREAHVFFRQISKGSVVG